jgi:hypothetical protein
VARKSVISSKMVRIGIFCMIILRYFSSDCNIIHAHSDAR